MEEDPQVKLATLGKQLEQVDAAIELDPTNAELQKLRSDLSELVSITKQLVSVTEAGEPSEAKIAFAVGQKVSALYENDGSYMLAQVEATTKDGYFVKYVALGFTAEVRKEDTYPYQPPDPSQFQPGTEVLAQLPTDGQWYAAVVTDANSETVMVRFQGYTDQTAVSLESVLLRKDNAEEPEDGLGKGKKRKAAAAPKEAPVPKSLQVMPGDSEDQILKKKKKLNMWKRQVNKDQAEKSHEVKAGNWQSFLKKGKVKSINNHDPRWDPTRDRMELAARAQQDKFFEKQG